MCATSDPYCEILPVMSVSSDFVCGAGKPEIRAGLRYVAQSRLIIDRVAERQSRDDADAEGGPEPVSSPSSLGAVLEAPALIDLDDFIVVSERVGFLRHGAEGLHARNQGEQAKLAYRRNESPSSHSPGAGATDARRDHERSRCQTDQRHARQRLCCGDNK